jgi:hypothetical protein
MSKIPLVLALLVLGSLVLVAAPATDAQEACSNQLSGANCAGVLCWRDLANVWHCYQVESGASALP